MVILCRIPRASTNKDNQHVYEQEPYMQMAPPSSGFFDLRGDGLRCKLLAQLLHLVPHRCLLSAAVVVHPCAILRSKIIALSIDCGGVDDVEEDSQQVGVGKRRRIEGHLHGLCVTRATAAHLLVCRVSYKTLEPRITTKRGVNGVKHNFSNSTLETHLRDKTTNIISITWV